MKIIVGSDHIGRGLKDVLSNHLKELGYEVVDIGVNEDTPVDYPDIAKALAERVGQGEFERGLLVCGTGIGMAIVANKVPNVRAACCHDPYSAERARKSNDAQIITLGSQVIGTKASEVLLDIWLKSEFSGGGSSRKVEKIKALDLHYRRWPVN
jgi:ribose 5-phosphate isomerase B